MQEIFALIRRLSGSSASVLVTGDSGTGKELVAKVAPLQQPAARAALRAAQLRGDPRHAAGERAVRLQARRVHRRAHATAPGIFVEADGGTIFLDEIAELSPALQAKLLRVLQEGEIRPLGATRSEKVDVRVIAATNRDLEARLADGTFREDLYYRLNVIHIHLPPLRDRAEDILPLAEHFLARSARARPARTSRGFHETARKALLALRLAGQRARAGERGRARRRAGRGAAGAASRICRARRARAAHDAAEHDPSAARWRAG